MTRHMVFKRVENRFLIIERDIECFFIDSSTLQFDTLEFYRGLYSDPQLSSSIELTAEIEEGDKIGRYVYTWLNKIIGNIASALGDDEAVEEMMNTNVECEKTIRIIEKRITKWIDQYELPVCAGNGLYTEESPKHRIETDVLEAEYAAPLSGHSMEPDYYDGDILLIKAKGEAYDKDIVIISCEGEQYCRQYREIEGKAQYIALNKEGGSYKTIDASKAEEVVYQGKVVGVIRKVHLEDDIGKCLDDTEWEIE